MAVSWFKDTAEPSIKRMWGIVALLREHRIAARLLRSKKFQKQWAVPPSTADIDGNREDFSVEPATVVTLVL